MNIFKRVAQILHGGGTLHDASGSAERKSARSPKDWRDQRLAEAAQKYGKPFKCASNDLPREVIVGGKHLVEVPSGRGATRRLDAIAEGREVHK